MAPGAESIVFVYLEIKGCLPLRVQGGWKSPHQVALEKIAWMGVSSLKVTLPSARELSQLSSSSSITTTTTSTSRRRRRRRSSSSSSCCPTSGPKRSRLGSGHKTFHLCCMITDHKRLLHKQWTSLGDFREFSIAFHQSTLLFNSPLVAWSFNIMFGLVCALPTTS